MPEMDLDDVELDTTKTIGWTPPKSEHVHYDPPVLGYLGMKPEIVVPEPNVGSACVVDGRVVTGLVPGDRIRVRRAKPRFMLVETGRHEIGRAHV